MFEKILNDANIKWGELTSPNNIWIRVSYGASGQAAGASYVYDKLSEFFNLFFFTNSNIE